MSSYEEKVAKILNEQKVKYNREQTFKNLKNGLYRFDFYLPEQNILIEVDGQQHLAFSKVFYKSRADFLKARERDRQKNAYALAHKIPLYRIPYYDMDYIKTYEDLFKDEYLVSSIYHNDKIRKERKLNDVRTSILRIRRGANNNRCYFIYKK